MVRKATVGTTESEKPVLPPEKLRRSRPPQQDVEPEPKPVPVSAGPVDRVVELAFNPSREKIREVTSIDRVQGRLLPQLDIIDLMWKHVIEIATFRQDATEYEKVYKRKRPVPPNLIDEFTYRTAQWQKSVQGMNLKSAIDLALAETETRAGEGEDLLSGHGFED